MFQQGAIEHTYKLIACLFIQFPSGGVGEAQQQQKQQKPRRFGERPPCALSVGVRKTQADGSQSSNAVGEMPVLAAENAESILDRHAGFGNNVKVWE